MAWGKGPGEPTATGDNVWSGETPVVTQRVPPAVPRPASPTEARRDDIAIPPIPKDSVRVDGRTGGWANPDADD